MAESSAAASRCALAPIAPSKYERSMGMKVAYTGATPSPSVSKSWERVEAAAKAT